VQIATSRTSPGSPICQASSSVANRLVNLRYRSSSSYLGSDSDVYCCSR
jgi:hypothetical protein